MRRSYFLLALAIVSVLVLSQKSFAQDWRPISEITEKEISIIEAASLTPAQNTLKNAKSFAMSGSVVSILFTDDSLGYFAAGNLRTAPKQQAWTKPEEAEDYNNSEGWRMFSKFTNIWPTDEGERTPERIAEADQALNEYLTFAASQPESLAYGFFDIGLRGNRYLKKIEEYLPISSLDPKTVANLYDGYISISGSTISSRYTLPEDVPNDNEKLRVIQKLREILLYSLTVGEIALVYKTKDEIARLDQATYEELKNAGWM